MILNKASHKAFLYQTVNLENGQLKRYPLDKLGVAISTSKVLAQGFEEKDGQLLFKDGEISFTAEEWVFLKETLKGVKEATLAEGKVINELKELFAKE